MVWTPKKRIYRFIRAIRSFWSELPRFSPENVYKSGSAIPLYITPRTNILIFRCPNFQFVRSNIKLKSPEKGKILNNKRAIKSLFRVILAKNRCIRLKLELKATGLLNPYANRS